MQPLFNTDTLAGIAAGLTVVSGLRLVQHVFEFLWRMRQKKDEAVQSGLESLAAAVQQNTAVTVKLESRLGALEVAIAAALRLKGDVRRLFAIVKILAGSDWETVKRQAATETDEDQAA